MNPLRKIRLQNAIRLLISQIIRRHIDDPRLGFITLTDVQISKDDKYAFVYYSVIGSEEQRESTQKVLSAASKKITKLLYQELDVRALPMLRFKFDETPSKAERIEKTFKDEDA
ncbi:MAG TPA: 30S ribosome-binding factor RbfA [Caldisericia bacterium]|nr:30S ribosome-binding factor RbfA [Caldisericia bacterium]HPF48136.1 30S ribosome-binding factor RbfA [Caldisericia bacterium]HPI83927.1 30S ribosome-binding factor RbfA [Caldisericia bacterium]HPQ92589.1 30S ribosome-binding factor RbfA [Caldisericia bacterium]HRV74313.1 30S ribosome-binding factor RbfA [Caldisericia bacterium]